MSSRLTKKSLVSTPGLVGEDAVLAAAVVGAERTQAADQHRQLRRGHVQQVRPLEQQLLQRSLLARAHVVAEPVGPRFEHRERLHIGVLLRGVGAPGAKCTVIS